MGFPTKAQETNEITRCPGKLVSDLELGGGFWWVPQFPPPLTMASHKLATIWHKRDEKGTSKYLTTEGLLMNSTHRSLSRNAMIFIPDMRWGEKKAHYDDPASFLLNTAISNLGYSHYKLMGFSTKAAEAAEIARCPGKAMIASLCYLLPWVDNRLVWFYSLCGEWLRRALEKIVLRRGFCGLYRSIWCSPSRDWHSSILE